MELLMSKQKIVLTYGPPGCGKSSWAKAYVKKQRSSTVIVNRDDIRRTMFGDLQSYVFNDANENYVQKTQETQVLALLDSGKSVVIADTNLHPKTLNFWTKFAKDEKVKLEVHDFFKEFMLELKTPDVHPYFQLKLFRKRCKDWNMKRLDSVPESVIDTMINSHIAPNYMLTQMPAFDPSLPTCIISDVDGTLMHRLPMANGKVRNPYDESLVLLDTPDAVVCESVQREAEMYKLFIFSGRHESCKVDTLQSLYNAGIEPEEIYMRANGDTRSDDIVKYELYMEHIHGKYNIRVWYDDRDQVVSMLRNVGIKVFQVNDGNF